MTSLINIDDLKILVPIREGFEGADARINVLIEIASIQVEKFANRSFEKVPYTEILHTNFTGPYPPGTLDEFSGGLQRSLQDAHYVLGGHPVDVGVPIQIFYDVNGQFAADTELILDTDFFVITTTNNTKILLKYSTKRKRNSLKITYTAGYDAVDDNDPEQGLDSLPESLKHAMVLQVMHLMNKVKLDSISVDEDRSADGDTGSDFSVTAGLIPEAQQLLSEFIRAR